MKQGARIARARTVTLALVLIAVIISLAFDSGLGTPSSFGVGQFFLLCPLGGLESLLASKSLIPVTLISLAVVVVLTLVFGRSWCAWGCPAPVIRRFFRRDPKPEVQEGAAGKEPEAGAPSAGSRPDAGIEACAGTGGQGGPGGGCPAAGGAKGLAASLRHLGRDTRTWVLAGLLVATFVAGLPLFCLVCPIGLTFGTVGSLWHLIVDKQVTLSAAVFPAALVVELVLYRKWCLNLCPVAGLLNIFGQFAKLFRPHIDATTCLRTNGKPCTVCASVCSERINLHAADAAVQLGECTRCGECAKHCPTQSIRIEAKPSGRVVEPIGRQGGAGAGQAGMPADDPNDLTAA